MAKKTKGKDTVVATVDVGGGIEANVIAPATDTATNAATGDLTGVHRINGESGVSVVIEVDPKSVLKGFNSRIKPEVNQDQEDLERAVSMAKNGQKVPCIVKRLAGGALEMVAGEGRQRSALKIVEGFDYKGGRIHLPEFKLRVAVDDSLVDDKAAFIASIIENKRNPVSPLNLALQQKVLREDFKMSNTAIAQVYGYVGGEGRANTNAISRFENLLKLDEGLQNEVHTGEMSLDAAIKFSKLKPEQQEKLRTSGTKITAAMVGEMIAAEVEAKGESTGGGGGSEGGSGEGGSGGGSAGDDETPRAVPRNAAKVTEFLDEILTEQEGVAPLSDEGRKFAQAFKKFMKGTLTTETFAKKWREQFPG